MKNELTWSKSASMPKCLTAVVNQTRPAAPRPCRRVTRPPNFKPGVDGPSKATNLSPPTSWT